MITRRRTHSKRSEMVNAALKLFAEKGIKGTTIRDIAHEAGVTEGALYRHFESKEQLAQSLFGECAAMLYQSLSSSIEGVAGAHEKLCALANGFFDFAETNPEAYEFVMARHHESVGGPTPGQPLPKDVFVQVMREGMEAGKLRPMDEHLAAAMMIGMCLRTIFFWDRGMIKGSRQEVMEEICHALHAMFEVKRDERHLAGVPRELRL
jgi:TetR/AcrR family transcriptional regulator, repressor of fatR-cypB operon